jgi:hypothetical protein
VVDFSLGLSEFDVDDRLNDDLDAANQDDLLDKASELAKNPIVEKFLTIGAAFLEQQMNPQKPAQQQMQQQYPNYQVQPEQVQPNQQQFTDADFVTPKFAPIDSFKNGTN